MPIFEYVCEDCGIKFEKLIRRTAEANDLHCPTCSSDRLTQQLSTFAAHANGRAAEPAMPSCPGGVCQTPGLCGQN
ncbi:MAG: zinc ribbon domain-containing protein [Bryobacteraceae bacterium]|nr:zinc ribbon domain-containing protein [Bryobacteraceae bacterium]MDW8380444.1 zinc ribbon domain-containing protein [Bryobacterales bacterium]